MNILVDSFAWLELLQGSEKGKRFLQILKENRGGIYTSVLNLYEIRYRVEELRNAKTADEFVKIVESYAKILDVARGVAIQASKIKLKMKKIGAIDCLILASAKINNLKVLTGDPHFDGVEGVIR
ncbi:MAG: PIN domain-containing protein [Methanobacteriota archaeon]